MKYFERTGEKIGEIENLEVSWKESSERQIPCFLNVEIAEKVERVILESFQF